MPAKDFYHDTVKNALIKDGWVIIDENIHLPWGGRDTYVDLGAEKLFAAEKDGRKIGVEVKSFIGKSDMVELEKAIGQFVIYRLAMKKKYPDWQLFLAVGEEIYNELFVHPDGVELIEAQSLKIIVFEEIKEVIARWIS